MHFTQFNLSRLLSVHVRKQLAECLILSKIDYNDIVGHPIPEYLIKRLQRVQLAAACFVLGRYAHMPDLIKLGWLPIKERRENQLLNSVVLKPCIIMTGRRILS